MKTFTYKDIESWELYYDPIKYISKDWEGTVLDVLKMTSIPVNDRLWVVLREECIDESLLHIFACDCAEKVLPIFEKKYPNDDRPRKAIEAKRKWLKKEFIDDQLSAAARAASDAWSASTASAAWAASAAARAASDARAATSAGWAATSAARAASDARAIERQWQIDHLIELLEGK